jgi:hypothetical protein
VHDVDRAPIRQRRHRTVGDLLEHCLVVERLGQQLARLGQKSDSRPSDRRRCARSINATPFDWAW